MLHSPGKLCNCWWKGPKLSPAGEDLLIGRELKERIVSFKGYGECRTKRKKSIFQDRKSNMPSVEIAFHFPTWGNLHYSCLGQFCTRTVGSKQSRIVLAFKNSDQKNIKITENLLEIHVPTLPATGVSLDCYEPGNSFLLTIQCLVNLNFLFPMLV